LLDLLLTPLLDLFGRQLEQRQTRQKDDGQEQQRMDDNRKHDALAPGDRAADDELVRVPIVEIEVNQ
jgi:hypothetical protein